MKPIHTIRITDAMKDQAKENYGAEKFLSWAKREESSLTLPEKVKLQGEMKSFLKAQGIGERGR